MAFLPTDMRGCADLRERYGPLVKIIGESVRNVAHESGSRTLPYGDYSVAAKSVHVRTKPASYQSGVALRTPSDKLQDRYHSQTYDLFFLLKLASDTCDHALF